MDEQAKCPNCSRTEFHLLIDDEDPDDMGAFWACFDCHYQESALIFAIPQQTTTGDQL